MDLVSANPKKLLEIFCHVSNIFKLLILVLFISLSSRVIYNVYFHPLVAIPGPKIAAATYLYQTYYSIVGGSRFYLQIGKLHEIYGPVVRITPDEIHLSDPNHFELIHNVGTKYDKDPQYYDCFGIGYSTFSASSYDLHRIRRSRLNPFFSRKKVLELEDIVQSKSKKLCLLISEKFTAGLSFDLHHALRAISIDIITDYAFNQPYNLLDEDDLGANFSVMMRELASIIWIFQQWPILRRLSLSLPDSLVAKLSSSVNSILQLRKISREQLLTVKADLDSGIARAGSRTTIFHDLLTPNAAEGYTVPPVNDLQDEVYTVIGAAAESTGNAMTVAAYHVISNANIYQKLTEELRAEFPDPTPPLSLVVLEKLPYLTAVIKEGLRLSVPNIGRLPRIVPPPGATFNGYTVPSGTIVSMSPWSMHNNETYFPNPTIFDPSRWLDPTEARRLDKAFIPFGKGSRGCVGMNLAYGEIYIVLGTIFRRFWNMKGNELKPQDLAYDDYFASFHDPSAKKFRVTAQ